MKIQANCHPMEQDQAGLTRTLQNQSFELSLNVMDLAISSCEVALPLLDFEKAYRVFKHAKRYYASVLRYSSHHAMTVDDCAALEFKSLHLEAAMAKLETRLNEQKRTPSPPPKRLPDSLKKISNL
jgi:hypothetical protein